MDNFLPHFKECHEKLKLNSKNVFVYSNNSAPKDTEYLIFEDRFFTVKVDRNLFRKGGIYCIVSSLDIHLSNEDLECSLTLFDEYGHQLGIISNMCGRRILIPGYLLYKYLHEDGRLIYSLDLKRL